MAAALIQQALAAMFLGESDRSTRRSTCFKSRECSWQCSLIGTPGWHGMRQAMGCRCQRSGLIAAEVELVKDQTLKHRVLAKQRVSGVIPCGSLWQFRCVQHLVHAPQRWCHHQSQCQPPRHPERAQLVHAGQQSHGRCTCESKPCPQWLWRMPQFLPSARPLQLVCSCFWQSS